MRFITILLLIVIQHNAFSDEYDYTRAFMDYTMISNEPYIGYGSVTLYKNINPSRFGGTPKPMSPDFMREIWPDFIRKCGDPCYSATGALLALKSCSESANDIIGNGSDIYDFALLAKSQVKIGLDGNVSSVSDYYTAPHFLASCGLVVSYRLLAESEPRQFRSSVEKRRERLIAILFALKSGKLEPVAEETIFDCHSEHTISDDISLD